MIGVINSQSTTESILSNFFCDFDTYSGLYPQICGGYDYTVTTGNAQIAGLNLDFLPSDTQIYITDFTSCKCLQF